jgi:hypothetical protein
VDSVAQRVAIRVSDLGTLIRTDIVNKLGALDNRSPILPVGPVAEFLKGKILDAVEQQIQSQVPALEAAIQAKVQGRVNQIKTGLENRISNYLTSLLFL